MTRPGGRSARVRAAVLDAADELADAGGEPLTVRRLAAASGVSEPTIYRRWRTAENVLLDATVRRLSRQSPVVATGDLRADLVTWADDLDAGLATPAGQRFLEALVRARGSSAGTLAPFLTQRIEQLRELLAADHAPASLTVETLLDHVLAPLYVRRMLGYAGGSTAELVDRVL
jgi:AcrR family transcriptional regulator